MTGGRAAFVAVTVAAIVGTGAVPAGAAPEAIALWPMNEGRGATSMRDTSGHGLHGSIGREVHTGTVVDGSTGYRFDRLQPDTPPTHPGHLVTVRDTANLDPGNRTYTVTLRLRTTGHFGNIIQKGQATVAGGNFKLQIPSGRVECLFRGSKGSRTAVARRIINDGRWHTVQCERSSTGVTLRIDGVVESRATGWTGSISNTWPVSIGGKVSCDQVSVGCDYFVGDIDSVRLDAF